MKRLLIFDVTVLGLLGFVVVVAYAQPSDDPHAGFIGPVWMTDIQNRIAVMGITLGLFVRGIKMLLEVRPLLFLVVTFMVALGATILAMWDAGIAVSQANALGMFGAAGNVAAYLLGTGEFVDLGAKVARIDIKRMDATRRDHSKVSL
jgi:hypothetical protein